MPSTALRQTVVRQAKRVVVKLGTQLLTDGDGRLDAAYVKSIAAQCAALTERGIELTIVSSGAVGVGCGELGRTERPTDVGVMQAVAAIGQSGLMSRWREAFAPHGLGVGQMLLTRADFDDRQRYLNIRNCLGELHSLRAVPIINENDTVSVEEMRFGDNDVLAALVANALRADLLIVLTVVDGVRDLEGNVMEIIHDALDARALIQNTRSPMGSGGMATKLDAARLITDAGEVAVIASGREPNVITRVIDGDNLGTVFVPANRKLDSRQRWIGMTARPRGTLTVDDGAARALVDGGKSLLATGISEITGRFESGDVVIVRDQRGRELARGLINYDSRETRTIMGHKSGEFADLLGRRAYDEVVHRDNLVMSTVRD